MWPIWALGGLAAAVLLSSCKDKKEEPASTTSPPPSTPPVNGLPEITQDGYRLAFREDLLAAQIYQGMQKLGIKPADLDQGCTRRKVQSAGGIPFEKISEKDKMIHSCEIFGMPLVRYKQFPELAAMITQKPIPWSLDDFDPTTSEDQKVRESIHQTIHFVDQILKAKGYDPNQLEYQQRMALALNYRVSVTGEFLAMLQDAPDPQVPAEARKMVREELKRVQDELKAAGIPEFWDHLKANAFPRWKSDFSVELPALEAIKAQTGDCTEQSKVLFGALEMAGLTASFIEIDPWRSENWILRSLRANEPNYRHVALQVEFEKSFMVLDPALMAVNPPHQSIFPLTLRQFAALELSNRAMGPTVQGGKGDLNLLDRAVALDDFLDIPLMNRGKLRMLQEGQPQKALEDYDRAVAVNPKNPFAFEGRAKIHLHQKNIDLALQDFDKAIELNPLVYVFFQDRGAVRLMQNRMDAAEVDFKKALELDPERAFPLVVHNSAIYIANRSFSYQKEELDQIKKELGKDPAQTAAQIYAVSWLVDVGHPKFAKRSLQSLVTELLPRKPQFSDSTRSFLGRLQEILKQATQKKDPSLQALWGSLLK